MRYLFYLIVICLIASLFVGMFLLLQGFHIVATQPSSIKNTLAALPAGSNITLPTGLQNTMPIETAFPLTPFRIIKTIKSTQSPTYLTIVTSRSIMCGDRQCSDDTRCGTPDGQAICYFFTEPAFDRRANSKTEFVGRWTGMDNVYIDVDTPIGFTDPNTVRFVASGETTKGAISHSYELNLTTHTILQIN